MARQLLGTRERQHVTERLSGLVRPIRLLVFRAHNSRTGEATEDLARELCDAVPALRAEVVYDEDIAGRSGRARFAAFGIEHTPALAIGVGDGQGDTPDNGIRFYGFPGGYEFDSLLEALGRVSRADPGFTAAETAELNPAQGVPMHLQVFITPTCPYCPRMVQVAHRLALYDPAIRADMVDALEFPDLADRYNVRGVPLTVVDETLLIEGAVPEHHLLQQLREHRLAASHVG